MSMSNTTAHEVKFVREISNPITLRLYIEAAQKRTDWDGMQPDIILTAAVKRLADLDKRRR